MVERAISRFIDVAITKDSPSVTAASFGILLILTDSDLLSTTRRIKRFTSDSSVSTFFGSTSEEYYAANAFFNQDPFNSYQPEEVYFGRYADAATAALLECGNDPLTTIATWAAISDGEFAVDIDGGTVSLTGLDFSAGPVTSLDDVATVIDTALGANGDCYYKDGRFHINSGTTGATSTITLLSTVAAPAGTDISGSSYLDGDTAYSVSNPGGSYLSQGQVAETVEAAITAIENVNNSWYAMSSLKAFRDITDTQSMATAIESRRKMFFIASNDASVLTLGDTSTFSYFLKNNNYKRSGVLYHDNTNRYPDMSLLGQQLAKPVGSTNWAYKTLAGIAEGALYDIDPVTLTETQKDAAIDVNCNLYSTTLGADFTYFGTMGGGKNVDKDGEFIDIIRNIDFLQARVEEGLLSLLVEKDIIPYTNAGISMVDNRLKSMLDLYGVKQKILVEGSVTTSFPKRSETTATQRDDRILPDGEFTAQLQGAIDTVTVRGKVYV